MNVIISLNILRLGDDQSRNNLPPVKVEHLNYQNKHRTSWPLLGPRVEVGLMPNFMKGIHIFLLPIVGSFLKKYSTK